MLMMLPKISYKQLFVAPYSRVAAHSRILYGNVSSNGSCCSSKTAKIAAVPCAAVVYCEAF